MSLSLYKKKRKFDETPEPAGGRANGKNLRFVVQEHHASRLHYDLRLEMDGVLKSWAVPKEPTLDPKQKRLAIHVEDHPMDYINFKGTIPKGNYGAGTVYIWDKGTYNAETAPPSGKKKDSGLLQGLKKGEIKFVLHGKKLKGSFALIKLKNEDNQWLLIKHRDKYAGQPIAKTETVKNKSSKPKTKKAATKSSAKVSKKKITDSAPMKIGGHELSFSNLEKLYWPKDKVTKGDLINYYHQVAPVILPYLRNRPQSLNRFPGGITGKGFYQKDVTDKVPDWVQQYPYTTGEGEKHNYLIPQSEADILFMANWGTIEMNPWNSTIENPDYPTWCLLDLDPGKKSDFNDVIKTANVINDILTEFKIKGYPKTSGSTGIHIYIPLNEAYTYDECQLFAKLIALEAERRLPDITSTERMVRNRKGKLYIDYLQNRPSATLAAPYSVRPKPGAPVSMPLHWEEVKKGLKITDFTIRNAIRRIEKEGDLFKPVLKKGINISRILKQLSNKKEK